MTDAVPAPVAVSPRTSPGRRFFRNFILIPLGFLAVIASVAVLFWNEGRAVRAAVALQEGERTVIEAVADRADPALDGKLVHVTGPLGVVTGMRDDLFPVGATDVVRLWRVVEMYQWLEASEQRKHGTDDFETVYTYTKGWSEKAVDTKTFHEPEGHANPAMPFASAVWDNRTAKLGPYRVDSSVLDTMENFAAFDTLSAGDPPAGFRHEGAGWYRGQDGAKPVLGDMRVRFSAVTPQTMSVVSAQQAGALTAYRAGNGYEIALSAAGVVPAVRMLKEQEESESASTWLLRIVGFVIMMIGFMLILGPVRAFGRILPFAGGLLQAGAFVIGIGLSLPLTLIVIAIAWLFYRPLLGIGLLLAAAIVFVGFAYRHRHSIPRPVPAKAS